LYNFYPLLKLFINKKPDYLLIHLITSLPILLKIIFPIKTKIILRISGLPKLNPIRKMFWRLGSKYLYMITCPTNETLTYLKDLKIFNENKIYLLRDPIVSISDISKKKSQKIDETFIKEKVMPTTELANLFSKYFTAITFTIAIIAGLYWAIFQPGLFWNSITAILMVACPCALTLSMPFTMSTTMAIFGRNKFYVKNQGVIQLLNEVNEIIFDKTGTLTESNSNRQHPAKVSFIGSELSEFEMKLVKTLTIQSTHPLSKMIANSLKIKDFNAFPIDYFKEFQGEGIESSITGNLVRLGKGGFIKSALNEEVKHTHSFLEINGILIGYFVIESVFRKNWQTILNNLGKNFKLFILSGDNDADNEKLAPHFNKNAIYFKQKPQDKLNFINNEQQKGNHVLMIGDGLNDAGALRQSNVGIAISEDIKVFSPACDAILDASRFGQLADFLKFSKTSLNIVKASFILSLVYNFIGIGWAVTGELSPVLAAIFMPLSSISVVLFAVGLTHLFAYFRRL
jgi:Cu+-exporting ATPase